MANAPTAPAPAPKIPLKQRLWKRVKRWFKLLAILYLVVCIVMYFLQTYLIFPGAGGQGTQDAKVTPHQGETLVPLKAADGTPITGLFTSANSALRPDLKDTPRPTVLYFYGNAESMADSRGLADLFHSVGCNCMLVDYEGFGMSGGKPSEQGCYAAAEAAYQYLLTRPDVDHKRLIPAGWSLGSGVAIDLAYRHRTEGTICALMTFSGFTSMVDTASAHYPFLPVSLLLKHRFMSIDKVPSLAVPYFLAHGKADNIVPYSQSDRLAAAYGKPDQITRYSSETASHNDFFDTDLAQLNNAIAIFMDRATK